MTPPHEHAAALAALPAPAAAPARRRARLARFARSTARHPLTTAQTCIRAAKLLPTVRQAVPGYVWPILALAAAVKCLPLDFGADETLFAAAFLLILWQRPGLLEALYHEAQAGKPARCQCARHARKAGAR